MAISIDRLSGGNTPADGSDPRTFPAIWNATAAILEANVGAGGASVTVSETAPSDPADGDLWWDSGDGEMYLWYDADSVWVSAAGPSVAVQSTAPTGYEGQLWLDDTDGSMYVYYTDPGGGSSSWIGAVSRSGGILQVVSTTKTDTFSASIGAGASTSVTGLTVDITPRSTSSKVLVTATIVGGRNGGQIGAALTADGTQLNLGDVAGSRTSVQSASSGGTDNLPSAITVQALHSPSTTSTVTYGVDLFGIITSGSTYHVNRSLNDTNSTAGQRSSSTITVMEIAG